MGIRNQTLGLQGWHRTYNNNCIMPISERFLSMPLEEKRKLYKCGKKLKLLDDVPTWPDFYQQNENRLKKAGKKASIRYLACIKLLIIIDH